MSSSKEIGKRSKLPWETKVDRSRRSRPMPDEALDIREAQDRARAHQKYIDDKEQSGLGTLDKEASLTATLASKKAQKLHNEYVTMRRLEPQTIDGQYSCKYSAWESALAAGPRGATSGGLRPLGITQFAKILAKGSDEGNTHKMQAKLNEAVKAAGGDLQQSREFKLLEPDSKGSFGKRSHGSVQKLESGTVHKINDEMSQIQKDEQLRLRKELEEQRAMARQISQFLKAMKARNPLKDKRKFEDTIQHNHGPSPGGWGSV